MTKLSFAIIILGIGSTADAVLNAMFTSRTKDFFEEEKLDHTLRRTKSAMRRQSVIDQEAKAAPVNPVGSGVAHPRRTRRNPHSHAPARAPPAAASSGTPTSPPSVPVSQASRGEKAPAPAPTPSPAPSAGNPATPHQAARRPRIRRKGPHAQI